MLIRAGLAANDGQLIIDAEAIEQRLRPRVVALPTERTRQYQRVLEERFETTVTADGTPAFHHPDGRRATLADIAEATGASSRGTAHRHLQRLYAADAPLDPDPAPPADGSLVTAGQSAIDSLRTLVTAAAAAGHGALTTTALTAIDDIARALTPELVDESSASRVAARSTTQHDAALRAPMRDTDAAVAAPVSLENEDENDSSQTHEARDAAPKRDLHASTKASEDSVPASARNFEALPDWQAGDWDDLIAPLSEAWGSHSGLDLRTDAFCVEMCLQWPRAHVRRAVDRIAADLQAGRSIKNPAGLLAAAARDGRLTYFPLATPPAPG